MPTSSWTCLSNHVVRLAAGRLLGLVLYAAYGSNLHPGRLCRRVSSARLRGTTTIEGWRLVFHKRSWVDDSGKCTLLRGPERESVYLAVYSIDTEEKPALDRIEGLGNGYEEVHLEIAGFGKAFAYLAAATHLDESLLPFFWYRDLVAIGCREHGFPEAYSASIRGHPAIEDPDSGRRALHRQLIGALERG